MFVRKISINLYEITPLPAKLQLTGMANHLIIGYKKRHSPFRKATLIYQNYETIFSYCWCSESINQSPHVSPG